MKCLVACAIVRPPAGDAGVCRAEFDGHARSPERRACELACQMLVRLHSENLMWLPAERSRSAAGDDGIHEDKELAGAGDEGELMSFSSCDQALVDRLQSCIPIQDSREGRRVEALPQALASAFDVPWTASQTAVVVIGSKPGEGGGLFATTRPISACAPGWRQLCADRHRPRWRSGRADRRDRGAREWRGPTA